MKKLLRRTLALLLLAFVAIQFVPADQSNPPVEASLEASPALLAVLRRACFDCHSHETVWPWYAKVAPISHLLAHDVQEGREHLNFSSWGQLGPQQQRELREEVLEEVEDGEMPLWFYVPLHPDASLSEADIALLREWASH